MGRKKRTPSLVSPKTQRELASLTGSMRAQTARHLAEEQCAFECTRRRPRTPSPRKPVSTVFTRLAGEDGEAAGEDAVAAYLKRCNHVRVVGKCVVRRSVAFESPQVATLYNDQLVCVEEERLLGDERRVRLSAPCIGWVSRKCLSVTEDLLNERKLRTLSMGEVLLPLVVGSRPARGREKATHALSTSWRCTRHEHGARGWF